MPKMRSPLTKDYVGDPMLTADQIGDAADGSKVVTTADEREQLAALPESLMRVATNMLTTQTLLIQLSARITR